MDLLSDSRSAYLMFCVVLLLWELTPSLLVVSFFRVKPPLPHPQTMVRNITRPPLFNSAIKQTVRKRWGEPTS